MSKSNVANQPQCMHTEMYPPSSEHAAEGNLDVDMKLIEETKLRYGTLVLALQSLLAERMMITRGIERQNSLPSVNALEACAKQAKDLEQRAAKARTEADQAVQDRDGALTSSPISSSSFGRPCRKCCSSTRAGCRTRHSCQHGRW